MHKAPIPQYPSLCNAKYPNDPPGRISYYGTTHELQYLIDRTIHPCWALHHLSALIPHPLVSLHTHFIKSHPLLFHNPSRVLFQVGGVPRSHLCVTRNVCQIDPRVFFVPGLCVTPNTSMPEAPHIWLTLHALSATNNSTHTNSLLPTPYATQTRNFLKCYPCVVPHNVNINLHLFCDTNPWMCLNAFTSWIPISEWCKTSYIPRAFNYLHFIMRCSCATRNILHRYKQTLNSKRASSIMLLGYHGVSAYLGGHRWEATGSSHQAC